MEVVRATHARKRVVFRLGVDLDLGPTLTRDPEGAHPQLDVLILNPLDLHGLDLAFSEVPTMETSTVIVLDQDRLLVITLNREDRARLPKVPLKIHNQGLNDLGLDGGDSGQDRRHHLLVVVRHCLTSTSRESLNEEHRVLRIFSHSNLFFLKRKTNCNRKDNRTYHILPK